MCMVEGFYGGGTGTATRPKVMGGYGQANRDFVSKARRITLPGAASNSGTRTQTVIDPTRTMR